jgi:hypothetical protein
MRTKACILWLAILIGQIVPARAESSAAKGSTGGAPLKISKINFLIHPVCWDLGLTKDAKPSPGYIAAMENRRRRGAWFEEREYLEILEWEKRVNQKQCEYIEKMRPDEFLVIYPIGRRQAMKDLEQFGQQKLGRRCMILRAESPNNKKIDSRSLLPEAVKLQLVDEMLDALQKRGSTWSNAALEVLEVMIYNRMIALEIQEELQKRNLYFDPKTVNAVAFGEGFEQCAMSWKAMVPYYLGLASPIENDFELSVSGMPLLRFASFKERIALNDDVRLFLWELKDGRTMALFSRARARLSDPPFSVTLPFDLKKNRVKVFSEHGEQLWPLADRNDLPVQADFTGPLKVPVYTSLRQLPTDRAAYIVASGMKLAEFRQALRAAPITPDPE